MIFRKIKSIPFLRVGISTSIVGFLLLNNFHCWFSNLSNSLWCFESGFGGADRVPKYFFQVSVSLVIIVWALSFRKIFNWVFAALYCICSIFVIINFVEWLGKLPLFSHQLIYIYYVIVLAFFIIRYFKYSYGGGK